MKPNFALSLSFDGISLLHRVHGGWHLVGEVALDVPDLAGDLAALAAKARALDPTGLRTKIVLPDEQIKYMSFETSDRDVAPIEAAVSNALDGATPYALDELSYDWSLRGGVVHVAAVARETMAEAESFADEHGFNPLCFVAMPDKAAFAGEPFFGETAYAGRVLGPDESIDRESEVIRIIGAARLPEPDPVPEDAAPEPVATPGPLPEPQPEETAPAGPPEPAPPPPAAPDAKADAKPAPRGKRGRKKRRKARGDTAPAANPAAGPAFAFASTRTGQGATIASTEARAELPKVRFGPSSAQPITPVKPDGTTKPAPADTPAKAKAEASAEAVPAADAHSSAPAPEGTPPGEDAGTGLSPFQSSRTALRKRLGIGTGAPAERAKSSAPEVPEEAPVPAAPDLQPLATEPTLDEEQRMTVFGARRTGDMQAGQPRYRALLLTALLLLFLVAVAAWSAIFLDDGISGLFRGDDPVQTAEGDGPDGGDASTGAASPAPLTGDMETATDEAALLLPDATDSPDAGADNAGETEADQPPPLPETITEELTAEEARARYAVTGIWQIAPARSSAPEASTRQEVYRTRLDGEVTIGGVSPLPEARELRPGRRPATPPAPPPPGTPVELDERGLIAATPEGTETPDGIRVFAGPPPIKPPPTPPRAEPQVLDAPTAAAPDEPTLRPRPRPDSVTERSDRTRLDIEDTATDIATTDDDATTADVADGSDAETNAEIARPGPRLRPKSAQELAEEARAAADNDVSGAAATEQAVRVSLRPRDRPARMAALVEQAREAAAADPVSSEQRAVVGIPTSASVARAATDRNQISLRRLNLIGVYGKPGERRALVRLASGRYRKVQVGDRLDGGRVAAIGDDQLRYVKSGQSVVIKMPRG